MADWFGVNEVDSYLLMLDFINSLESSVLTTGVSWQMGLDSGVNGVDGR